MAIASRGGASDGAFADRAENGFEERKDLTLDLFISNSIYLATGAMAISGKVAYNLAGAAPMPHGDRELLSERENAEICD